MKNNHDIDTIESVRDMGGGSTKIIEHFVEWHDEDVNQLMKGRSYAQVCLYRDLGKVCCIKLIVCDPVCHSRKWYCKGS